MMVRVSGNTTDELSHELSKQEKDDLHDLEEIIEDGFEIWVNVGRAMSEIKQRRLYRETHSTWAEYTQSRWSMSDRHADRHIAGAKAVDEMNAVRPIGLKTPSESQARELRKIEDPKERAEVWKDEPTAAEIRERVASTNDVAPAPVAPDKPRIRLTDDNGRAVPDDLEDVFSDVPDFEELTKVLERGLKLLRGMQGRRSASKLNLDVAVKDLCNVIRAVKFARPAVVVPKKGKTAPEGFWCEGQAQKMKGVTT